MNRHITRRRYLLNSFAATAALAVAGCAASTASPSPTAATAGAKLAVAPTGTTRSIVPTASARTTIAASRHITLYFARTAVCRLCGAVDYWNAHHPEAKVQDQDVPWSSEKQQAALAAKKGGPDLYQADPDEVQRDMLGHKLLDVTDAVQPIIDKYLRFKVEQFRHPKTGKIYAFPWQVAMSVMYYRQDILGKLGMSEFPDGWTWDQHEQLAVKAKKDFGLSTNWLGSGATDKDDTLFEEMLWQAGGTYLSNDGTQVELDSPIAVDVVKRLQRWWQQGLLFEGSFYTAPLWGAMRTGLMWSDCDVSAWLLGMSDNIKKPEDHVGDWRIAPMPAFQKGGPRSAADGGGGLTSPAYTAEPDLVKEFGVFATTDIHGMLPTIQQGTILAGQAAFTDPESLAVTLPVTGSQKIDEIFAKLINEVPLTFFYGPGWNEVNHILAQNLLSLVKGDSTAEPGMKKIADMARTANQRWVKLLEQD